MTPIAWLLWQIQIPVLPHSMDRLGASQWILSPLLPNDTVRERLAGASITGAHVMKGTGRAVIALVIFGTVSVTNWAEAPKERVILRKDLSAYAGKDMMLTVRELEVAPGAVGQKHRHPGPVVVYVLQGAVEVHLEGEAPKVVHAGESFSEDARQLHLSTRNMSNSEPARLLSYIISRSGEALSQPEK